MVPKSRRALEYRHLRSPFDIDQGLKGVYFYTGSYHTGSRPACFPSKIGWKSAKIDFLAAIKG